MNENQRKVLIGIGSIILIMLIFPPYQIAERSCSTTRAGYAFIFDLPWCTELDATTLFIQWIGVLIVGAIAFFVFKKK